MIPNFNPDPMDSNILKEILDPKNGIIKKEELSFFRKSDKFIEDNGAFFSSLDKTGNNVALEERPSDTTTTYAHAHLQNKWVLSRPYYILEWGVWLQLYQMIIFFPFTSAIRSFIFRYGSDVKEICKFNDEEWENILAGAEKRDESHLFDRKTIKIVFCNDAGDCKIPAASGPHIYEIRLNSLITLVNDTINIWSSTVNTNCSCYRCHYDKVKLEQYSKFVICKHILAALMLLYNPEATTQDVEIEIERPKFKNRERLKEIFLPLKLFELPYIEGRKNPIFWKITRKMIKWIYIDGRLLREVSKYMAEYCPFVLSKPLSKKMIEFMVPKDDYEIDDNSIPSIVRQQVKNHEMIPWFETTFKGRITQTCEQFGLIRRIPNFSYLRRRVNAPLLISKIAATVDGKKSPLEISIRPWRGQWLKNPEEWEYFTTDHQAKYYELLTMFDNPKWAQREAGGTGESENPFIDYPTEENDDNDVYF